VIIGIDGASSDLSIALVEPGGELVAEVAWTTAHRQSAELLPHLAGLMEANARRWSDVTALAIGIGPGSFTGLRVAMALAKGLAYSLNRPILGVPSLDAWLDAEPEATVAVARAGAREAYRLDRAAPGPLIVDLEGLRGNLGGAVVVAPADVAAACGLDGARQPRAGAAIARRAGARLEGEPRGDDLETLEPIYLRAPRGVTNEAEGAVKWL
jgi:tRNA threonylcarbamoyl adenosine modification protein YeaZ